MHTHNVILSGAMEFVHTARFCPRRGDWNTHGAILVPNGGPKCPFFHELAVNHMLRPRLGEHKVEFNHVYVTEDNNQLGDARKYLGVEIFF